MTEHNEPVVGGLTPFTTIDFPGRLAAVVFMQGCPWRCTYCHNPHLLPRRADGAHPWRRVREWLDTRRGLLDGVVFSGGEPLLQAGLDRAVHEVRAMGFACALHTAGPYPQRLTRLLPALDWVGFDVKAPFGEYREITGADDGRTARRSLERLLASGIAYEIRCTLASAIHNPAAIDRLARQLAALGITRLVLQTCRDASLYSTTMQEETVAAARCHLATVELRH